MTNSHSPCSAANASELRHRIASITIDDEGHRNSELQQVLVAGYMALKWALPLQATVETLEAIAANLESDPADTERLRTSEEALKLANGIIDKLRERVAVLELVIFEELTPDDCHDELNAMVVEDIISQKTPGAAA